MTAFERFISATTPSRTTAKAALGTNFDLLRAGGLIVLLPSALFAKELGPIPAVSVLVGCLLVAAILLRAAARPESLLAKPIDLKMFAGCGAAALALCALGGEGRIFFANYDWLIRDAVLADLVKHETINVYGFDNHTYFLRAPFGMYLAPAMVGRAFGLIAAHWALLVQNASVLGVVLYFVAALTPRFRVAAVAVFVLFSGVDILPTLILNAEQIWRTGHFTFERQLDWWNGDIQYSSHLTQLFWTPNHMLPAWWFAALALLYARREVGFALLVASFAPLLFWSPLAMLGALPFLLLFWGEEPRSLLAPDGLAALVSGAAFLPIALFLTVASGDIPHEFLLWRKSFWLLWPIFLAVEIPHTAILALRWRLIEECDRRIILVAIASLVLIPIYSMGENDDFAMRVSSLPMFLLAFAFTRVAVLTPRDGGRMATTISCLVIISATTPGFELRRAFVPASPISDCNFMTAWKESEAPFPYHYLAPREAAPAWLNASTAAPLEIEQKTCRLDRASSPQQ